LFEFLDKLTNEKGGTQAQSGGGHMKEIAPTMPVRDLERAIAFYQDMLGFATVFHNPAVFALLRREGVRIGLQHANKRPPGTGNCYIWVEDIRSVYRELRDKGVSFEDDIAQRTYPGH